MTRAVFFDAGHTLLFAHPDLGTVYAEATARFGVRIAGASFVDSFRPAFQEHSRKYAAGGRASDALDLAMWRDITREIHSRVPELSRVPFEPWFEALYARFGDPEVWRLYPEVESTLGDLRARGLRLGVVSNWDTRLRKISAGLGLDRLVDFIVISSEVGFRKPDPEIFREALRRAGVEAAEAIHVGDLLEEDVEGARRAGVRPVLLDRRAGGAAVERREGHLVVGSLGQVAGLI